MHPNESSLTTGSVIGICDRSLHDINIELRGTDSSNEQQWLSSSKKGAARKAIPGLDVTYIVYTFIVDTGFFVKYIAKEMPNGEESFSKDKLANDLFFESILENWPLLKYPF